ncbi:hypothetical protein A4D02_34865 [Niastella koreensis]|uniref:Aminoglycoside phosphotransferase n=2 Tax=Niastella koreensis TaxID=354356 RepID=G8TJB7_NIAKG|nr:hypothetical protein [Niastella koreensis]AEV98650.1 hypothetical protein Niako_2305 [Niastella koreensis GR20-10]OQP44408.1 hypothetical protein A4D02_34865 [Niastella koreensis]
MTKEQINKLLTAGQFPEPCNPVLVETHISWVVIGDHYVYKIKKPVHYSFLDFSTLEKRKFYCEREIALNKRLTEDLYLGVQPVRLLSGGYIIGGEKGEIVDFSVEMRKIDNDLQMDVMLPKNSVTKDDIRRLAEKIASFHKHTTIMYDKDLFDIQKKFNDLGSEKPILIESINRSMGAVIDRAIKVSNEFTHKNISLLTNRLNNGYVRDCHGDLHTRNIFLFPNPQPFDCIEFNDDYRQIDVLNEIAFLCMDLDAAGRQDLSDLFVKFYNDLFPAMRTAEEYQLFVYYKSYRANIRAKVNSLRARSAGNETEKTDWLRQSEGYLKLMEQYINLLNSE